MFCKRKLYGFQPSPPVRAVLLTLKALNLDYVFITVNIFTGEQNTPQYLKKNPQHTIPVLEETDGTCIWDSHAICAYLVRRYGKDDSLYPKDYYQRAVVDQRLHYENGIVYAGCLQTTLAPLLCDNISKAEYLQTIKKVDEIYDMLERFLGDNKYMAGNALTIADLSLISSISSLALVAPPDAQQFAKVIAWLQRIAQLPYYYEANEPGNSSLRKMLRH